MPRPTFLNFSTLRFLDDLQALYQVDPQRVDPSWRHFFEGVELGGALPSSAALPSADLRIFHLIEAYRYYGHLLAYINPIAARPMREVSELTLQTLGFRDSERDALFPTCGFLRTQTAPLKELIAALQKTYCRSVGFEYMGLGNPALERWLQQRIEPFFEIPLSSEAQLNCMRLLKRAELFENFLHAKYLGQKRFSLEGAETLIPMLEQMIEVCAESGTEEVVLGMSHRGRLNVLANILSKSFASIFQEFEDHYSPEEFEGTGDVKYHKGFIGALTTRNGKQVKVMLAPNASHLESVDPIVMGEVRAKQELMKSSNAAMGILVHGDAALAGQGVVYETLQLHALRGYQTGGTVHIVVNNQIGFTALPKECRSTRYCSDIAKAFGACVFHVNAEDVKACVAVARLAAMLRMQFQCDVFIDLNCYRKYGHNESDEPMFTQPLEYQLIQNKRSIREGFEEALRRDNLLSAEQLAQWDGECREQLRLGAEQASLAPHRAAPRVEMAAAVPIQAPLVQELISLAERFCTPVEGFHLHPKVQKLLHERLEMVRADPNTPMIDWGMAEHLAFASLLVQGVHVRLSGQDCRRGTFSHRHAAWVDQVDARHYFPLSHLSPTQAPFDIFNSSLSEFAVLGFEFGYSLIYKQALVIWEAQFGDFANGAQIIIDQYLAAAEQKWAHRSGLVLFLPHGYDGQGPEHSSARMERFLQLCAEGNLCVANCTTPAQLFHLLRRQAFCEPKKPLVLFTPKSLLRHPLCLSSLLSLQDGCFAQVLDDPVATPSTKRLVVSCGKIYYDLVQQREKRGWQGLALIRIEQLYPFPEEPFKLILQKYPEFEECIWVQEEHENMGAWDYIRPLLAARIGGKRLRYVGRGRSASAAAGSWALHQKQQVEIFEGICKS